MVDNVLLITIDSLRYDAWVELRPELRAGPALEADGVSFERAFASGPGTSPSFPGMLTGTHALSHGGLGPLAASRPRVATELGRAGLTTGGFHSNPFLSRYFDYDVGFDEFQDYQNPLMGVATKVFPRGIEISNPKLQKLDDAINLTGFIKYAYKQIKGKSRPYVNAEVITDDAIEWLSSTDEPFFCWAHYMDVHHPCFPPREYREAFGVDHVDNDTVSELYTSLVKDASVATESQLEDMENLYRAAIKYVDDQISRLIGTLEDDGRFADTLVVLTSDHGELHGEHGHFGKPARMYDELLHVPLVVANGPKGIAECREQLVSLIDIPPLCHEALGIEIPSTYEGELPGGDPREYVVAEHQVDEKPIVGVRSANWLYEHDAIENERRLFELPSMTAVDPDAVTEPEATMVRDAGDRRAEGIQPEAVPTESRTLDRDVESRLKDLGYR
jgi:arylsulfatase A-like enzyme